MESPSVLARIVRLPGHPGKDTSAQAIRAEDGCLPVGLPLSAAGFEPGDLIEIRLVRRDGESGYRPRLPDQFGQAYGSPISDSVRDQYLTTVGPEAEEEPFSK